MKKIAFVDAQEMAKQYPDSFEAPSWEDLENIQIGEFIKVCIENERFWCKVLEIENQKLKCQIDNDLVYTDKHGLLCGDIIFVEKRHIYSIYEGH